MNKVKMQTDINELTKILEETTGAALHFYYSKIRSKWVCYYGYQKFFFADTPEEIFNTAKSYILNNRIETGKHYKLKIIDII